MVSSTDTGRLLSGCFGRLRVARGSLSCQTCRLPYLLDVKCKLIPPVWLSAPLPALCCIRSTKSPFPQNTSHAPFSYSTQTLKYAVHTQRNAPHDTVPSRALRMWSWCVRFSSRNTGVWFAAGFACFVRTTWWLSGWGMCVRLRWIIFWCWCVCRGFCLRKWVWLKCIFGGFAYYLQGIRIGCPLSD